MKRIVFLITAEAFLSLAAGYLVSKMSWIARVGINLFHGEYRIFKSWGKTTCLFFSIQLVLILFQWWMYRKSKRISGSILSTLLLLSGIVGLYITYNDFQHTFTHRLLREKAHLGFYLFWLGWISSCTFFLVAARKISDQPAT